MANLQGTVAVVAGSSRGAGKGIALALGEAGATVYVTGRTIRGGPAPVDGAPGTIEDTAEEVSARGGVGIAVRVDHTRGEEVEALFARIEKEQGKLDVLANAVWGGNECYTEDMATVWGRPFWDHAPGTWGRMMDAGPRAYLLASIHAGRLMARHGKGLIAHVTDGIDPDGTHYRGHLLWDLSHECINRMALGMGQEAKPAGVTVVALNPGFMRTERVHMHLKTEEQKKEFGYDRSESPEYIGRAVAALAGDPDVLRHAGQVLWVADLAREYGFTDVDGKRVPRFDPHGEGPTPPSR